MSLTCSYVFGWWRPAALGRMKKPIWSQWAGLGGGGSKHPPTWCYPALYLSKWLWGSSERPALWQTVSPTNRDNIQSTQTHNTSELIRLFKIKLLLWDTLKLSGPDQNIQLTPKSCLVNSEESNLFSPSISSKRTELLTMIIIIKSVTKIITLC